MAGCGPTLGSQDGSGSGESGATSRASTGSDGDSLDGPNEGGDADETGQAPRGCDGAPGVLSIRSYEGMAERTVGRDMVRGADGNLYVGGSMADARSMSLWLAAMDAEGELLWESAAESVPGGNLSGSPPTAQALAVVDGTLYFAGSVYAANQITGLLGNADTADGQLTFGVSRPGLRWSALGATESHELLVAGDNNEAAAQVRVERLAGASVLWSHVSPSGGLDEVAGVVADGEQVYLAGRSMDGPWFGRYSDPDGAESVSTLGVVGTNFEPESGRFYGITKSGASLVATGWVRQEKPDPEDGVGSYDFGEIVVVGFSSQGQQEWLWQRSATVIRPGTAYAAATGPDGTVYVTGDEGAFGDDDGLFVAAFTAGGELLWIVDDDTVGDEILGHTGVGISSGADGRLHVLTNRRVDGAETTAIVELCL